MKYLISPILAGLALALGATWQAQAQTATPIDLRILAINDFHGYLRPPPGGIRIADPADKTKIIAVPAGGAEHMATLVRQLRDGHKNTIFVAAGDLIGASPFLSAMFHDEPTIESLSMMGLDVASVGNHEFDEGKDELLRMQNGGCHPKDGCQGPHPFAGAKFRYLAASTIEKSTGKSDLRRPVRRPAVPQPAGDDDADGQADQAGARAAMARSKASAHPPRLEGFQYAWDAGKPDGERIIAERMSLNGQPIDPAAGYRVTVNNYLSVGGDGFTALKDGTAQQVSVYDVDALDAYFQVNSPVSPRPSGRIVRLKLTESKPALPERAANN